MTTTEIEAALARIEAKVDGIRSDHEHLRNLASSYAKKAKVVLTLLKRVL
jgi:hypothetical protein